MTVDFPSRAWETAIELARKHGPERLGVRTLDSLHVACALELKAERFWTFDERQARAGRGGWARHERLIPAEHLTAA